MKILAINGSHRGPNGYTSFLLSKIEAGAVSAGAGFETIELSKYRINRCIACSKCQTEAHYKQCIFDGKDDATGIIAKIEEADALILASPVYVFNISSLLKSLLERYYSRGDSDKLEVTRSGLMFHDVSEKLKNKPFLALIVSNNMEEATTEASEVFFRNFARFMDLGYMGTIRRPNGKLAGYGKDRAKEEAFPLIKVVYSELESIGRQIALHQKVKKSSLKVASRLIIPVPFLRQLMKVSFIKKKIAAKAATKYIA
jgi:multimeric flavodoxin WrbA